MQFQPDCEKLMSEIRECPGWVRGFILYGNERRDLHDRIFPDFNYQEYVDEVQDALAPFIQQGEEAFGPLEEKRRAAIDAYNQDVTQKLHLQELQRKRQGLLALLKSKHIVCAHAMELIRKEVLKVFSPATEKEFFNLVKSNEEVLEQFFSLGRGLVGSSEAMAEKMDYGWFREKIGKMQKDIEFSPLCAFVLADKPEEGLDLRSRDELVACVEAEAIKRFPKSDEELKSEDVAYVKKKYPLYRFGERVEINTRVNGKPYVASGILKKVGPGKVMIGSKLVTLMDLPEEIRISFQPERHAAYLAKRIAECPVSFNYKQEREMAQRNLYFQKLLAQFQKNLRNGYVYADGEWIAPAQLIHSLLESWVPGS